MASDRHARQDEEPQHVLGQPIWDLGPHARQDEEPQHLLGYQIDSLAASAVDRALFHALVHHPVRTYKQWLSRRRLGPYAPDEDEP